MGSRSRLLQLAHRGYHRQDPYPDCVLQRLQQRVGSNQHLGEELHRPNRRYSFPSMYKQHYGVELGKKKAKLKRRLSRARASKTDLLPETRTELLIPPLPSNSPLVVFWLAFLPDLVNLVMLMVTSSRALSSSSTTRRSTERRTAK